MASFDEQVEFTRKYAQLAIDQHIKYGIPASVTLAQMAVESSWDKSGLAERANNCFGVTAGNSWKGPTVKEYDDNRWKDFRVYNSKEDSIEDHSRVLLGSNYMRYCAHLSSTDHLAPDYVSSIENVIKSNGFEKLDQMALEQAAQQGVRIGYMRGRQNEYKSSSVSSNISKEKKYILSFMPGTFSLPMNTNNMIVTSERGERNLGLKGASRNHKGIDIKADNALLFATEDNGRVIQAGFSGKGGNTVSIEYDRPDNSKVVVTYMHLSKIQVKQGDIVNGHQQIGVSGATGNVTGPHLHFQTDYIDSQGNKRNLDSAAYLAEISLRTNIPVRAISEKSKVDLVASYKSDMAILPSSAQLSIADRINERGYDSDEERRRRENQQEGGIDSTGDLLADLIAPLLKSAISLAIQLSSMDEEEAISKEEADRQAEKEVSGDNSIKTVDAYHSDRELATVDVNKLAQSSSAIYESEVAAEQQKQNQLKIG